MNAFILQIMVPSRRQMRAFGFIESLIAILITGIACTALIGVAVQVIREAKNNEIRDAMTQYAVQGFEKLRVMSVSDFDAIPCSTPGGVMRGYLEGGVIKEVSQAELCSVAGLDEGVCEKLPLPTGNDSDFFYREIDFQRVNLIGKECTSIKVTVRTGMLDAGSADPNREYPRNFVTNTQIVGYVASR